MKEIILNLTKKQKIIASIIIISIFAILFIYIYKNLYEADNIEELDINNTNEIEVKETEEKIDIKSAKEKVVIHIIGEVNNPGVVTLDEGSRIIDAINSAGGKTEEADLSKINLAYIVEDGTQIYIPRINENLNSVEIISSEAGKGVIIDNDTLNNTEINVNINTANKEKLMTLPGVGETTAQKIIEYRKQNGKFKNIEELKNVNGIGESKYNTLKDKITV